MNRNMGKRMLGTLLVVGGLWSALVAQGLAAEPAPGVQILKMDQAAALQVPENFRKAKDAFKWPAPDGKLPSREGLDALRLSGSRFFSQPEFSRMLRQLPAQDVVIVDLRGESHGFLNGNGMSWYSAYKRANFGKSSAQVEAIERQQLLTTANHTVAVAKLGKDKAVVSTAPLAVRQVMTERELAALYGVKYQRIAVSDYTPPTHANVDEFLALYKTLPSNAWIHMHCEAGEGRTTTFMAMVDMLHNAGRVSYDDIMARQWLLGGQDIRTATSDDPWKQEAYQARAAFTRHFYEYVKANPTLTVSWSAWAKQYQY